MAPLTRYQGHYFSEDGSKLAYSVTQRGSDWFCIHVMDVATGQQLPDRIDWCKFSSVAWNKVHFIIVNSCTAHARLVHRNTYLHGIPYTSRM